MAYFLTRDGDFSTSKEDIDRVVSMEELAIPGSPELTNYNYGVYYIYKGEYVKGMTHLVYVAILSGKDNISFSRDMTINIKDINTLECTILDIEEYVKWYSYYYDLADYMYLFEFDHSKAEEYYKLAIELHNHPIAMHNLAWNIYYTQNRFDEAEALLLQSAEKGYIHAMVHLGYYYQYAACNKSGTEATIETKTKALKWYLKAFEISPKPVAALLGNYYFQVADYKTALDYYLIAKKYVGCSINVLLGKCYLEMQDYPSAHKMFYEGAISNQYNCYILLGDYYFQIAKDTEHAWEWYSKAIKVGIEGAKIKLEQLNAST